MTQKLAAEKLTHLVELLNGCFQDLANQTAFVFLEDGDDTEQKITYHELGQKTKRIAAELQRRQLIGQRVILLYAPGLDYIAGFLACLYAGVIAVPAYPPDPSRLERSLPRLQAIIEDCEAKTILTSSHILAMADFIAQQAPDLAAMEWIASDQLKPGLENHWTWPDLTGDSLAFLQYTSGSTGDPKGVMLSHSNLLANMDIIKFGFKIETSDIGCSWLPPYHDMGLIGPILTALGTGISSILMSPLHFLQRPMRWLKAISKYKVSLSGGPNFAYELCARKAKAEEIGQLDLSCWSLAFSGAEPIIPATVERFVQTFGPCGFKAEAFYPCYGLAEATLIVSGARRQRGIQSLSLPQQSFRRDQILTDLVEEKMITLIGCGENFPGQKIMIAKPDTLTPCHEGEVGEVWVQGPSIAQGYWKKPEASAETFKAFLQDNQTGPFLRTGDLGFLKDHELYVTGRLKDLIIIRGENHYPQDIERSAEASHPALRVGCAAAFAIKVDYEEKLALAIEVETQDLKNPASDYESIFAQMREAIAAEHDLEVETIVLLKKGSIPKTSSGKIRRFATYEEWQTGKLEVIASYRAAPRIQKEKSIADAESSTTLNSLEKNLSQVKPLTQLRAWLVQNLADHLGLDPQEIDESKNLASYGLDSKDAVNLSGELEDYLGRSLSPTLLWKYPSIERLAAYLSQEETG